MSGSPSITRDTRPALSGSPAVLDLHGRRRSPGSRRPGGRLGPRSRRLTAGPRRCRRTIGGPTGRRTSRRAALRAYPPAPSTAEPERGEAGASACAALRGSTEPRRASRSCHTSPGAEGRRRGSGGNSAARSASATTSSSTCGPPRRCARGRRRPVAERAGDQRRPAPRARRDGRLRRRTGLPSAPPVGRAEPGARRVGCRERPACGEQGVERRRRGRGRRRRASARDGAARSPAAPGRRG